MSPSAVCRLWHSLAGAHDTPPSHHSTPALVSSAFLPLSLLFPLLTAVHSGDVVRFSDVLKVSQAKFQQDKTYTLIIRLGWGGGGERWGRGRVGDGGGLGWGWGRGRFRTKG